MDRKDSTRAGRAVVGGEYSSLHPKLLDEIERRVERAGDELPSLARLTWRLLIEKFHTAPDDPYDLECLGTKHFDGLRPRAGLTVPSENSSET